MYNRSEDIIAAKQQINDRVNDMLEGVGIQTAVSIKNKFLHETAKLTSRLRDAHQAQSDMQGIVEQFSDATMPLFRPAPPVKLTPEQEQVMASANWLNVTGKKLVDGHEKPLELAKAMIKLSHFKNLFTGRNIDLVLQRPSPVDAVDKLIQFTLECRRSPAHARHLIKIDAKLPEVKAISNYTEKLKGYLNQQLGRLKPGTSKHNLMLSIKSRLNSNIPTTLDELRACVMVLKNETSKHQHFVSIKRFGFFERAAPASRLALDKLFDDQNNIRPSLVR
jgi:hypothetical protein